MTRLQRLAVLVTSLLGTVACDQGTKQWAITHQRGAPDMNFLWGLVRITYAENPGAFLGLGGTLPEEVRAWLWTAGVGAMLLGMVAWMLWVPRMAGAIALGFSLLVAGGVGNLWDRVERGRVVDFVVLGKGFVRTGVFNVADVAIMAGAFMVAWWSRRESTADKTAADAPTDGSGPPLPPADVPG